MHHGTVWIASIVPLCESSSHIIVRDRRGLRPIARIEQGQSKRSRSPRSSQTLVIVSVMFSYDRPDRKQTFWSDRGDRDARGDHMRTSLKNAIIRSFILRGNNYHGMFLLLLWVLDTKENTLFKNCFVFWSVLSRFFCFYYLTSCVFGTQKRSSYKLKPSALLH